MGELLCGIILDARGCEKDVRVMFENVSSNWHIALVVLQRHAGGTRKEPSFSGRATKGK